MAKKRRRSKKETTSKRASKAATAAAADEIGLSTLDLDHIIEPLRPWAVDIDELHVDPNNPQIHDDDNLAAIASSLRQFGQDQPLVYRKADGVIVKGTGRYLAAKITLQWQHIAAIPVEDEIWEAAARAVADNRTSALSHTDHGLLAAAMQTIRDGDGKLLEAIGYSEHAIDSLLASITEPAGTGEDKRGQKPPENPVTEAGDIWILGDHRLICGDCTDPAVLEALMVEDIATMAFLDPPYGVDYQPFNQGGRKVPGDATPENIVEDLLKPSLKNAMAHLTQGAPMYIWHSHYTRRLFYAAMDALGIVDIATIIWAKPPNSFGSHDYKPTHEACFYAARAGRKPAFYGDRTNVTVWRIGWRTGGDQSITAGNGVLLTRDGDRLWIAPEAPRGRGRNPRIVDIPEDTEAVFISTGNSEGDLWEVGKQAHPPHPTAKPVELARRAIVNSTKPREIVLDTFAGAGGVIIAAETTNRVARLIENHRGYCDLIVQRWQRQTRQQPQRIKAERNAT